MSYLLADSINYLSIPSTYKAAGYVDGVISQWPAAGWITFPDAIKITTQGNDADAADVERYDMTPDMAGPWALRQLARGLSLPKIYVNRSNGHLVEANLDANGFTPAGGKVALWVATLDGTQLPTTWNDGSPIRYPIWAVQYANSAATGGNYDLSIVYMVFGGNGNFIGGQGMAVIETPFTIISDPDTHWYGTPAGQDMGLMGPRTVVVTTESADHQWYEYPGSTWWFSANKAAIVLPGVVTMDQIQAAIKAAIPIDNDITMDQVVTVINAKIAMIPANPTPSLWDVLKATFGK